MFPKIQQLLIQIYNKMKWYKKLKLNNIYLTVQKIQDNCLTTKMKKTVNISKTILTQCVESPSFLI